MGLPVLVALDFSHAPPIQGPCCRAIAIVPIKNTRVPEDVSRMLFGGFKISVPESPIPCKEGVHTQYCQGSLCSPKHNISLSLGVLGSLGSAHSRSKPP